MSLNKKLLILFSVVFFLVAILFIAVIFYILPDHEKENLEIYRKELLRESHEMVEKSAELFFELVNLELMKNKPLENFYHYLKDIDQFERSTLVLDYQGNSLLKEHSNKELEKAISLVFIEDCIKIFKNKTKKTFILDNFQEFLSGKDIKYKRIVLRVYDSTKLIICYGKVFDGLKERLSYIEERNDKNLFKMLWTIVVLLSIFSLPLGILISLSIKKSFSQPLVFAVELSNQIGAGKIRSVSHKISTLSLSRKDEIGTLERSLSNMIKGLQTIFQNIGEVSSSLDSLSQEVTEISSQQSTGIQEVSSSIAETTASVQEMNLSAKQVENKAIKVTESSTNAKITSVESQKIVQKALTGMKNIKARVEEIASRIMQLSMQSQKISNITETIQDIAEQTNMLALNAAIEAARAGESGKGFAVVANHVRELAQKSRNASYEIRELIQSIQSSTNSTVMSTEQGIKGVEEEMSLVNNTAMAFQKLLEVMSDVEEKAEEIRLASTQQSSASEQIAQAMCNINDVIKETVAFSIQTKQMVVRLNQMSKKLMDASEIFNA